MAQNISENKQKQQQQQKLTMKAGPHELTCNENAQTAEPGIEFAGVLKTP